MVESSPPTETLLYLTPAVMLIGNTKFNDFRDEVAEMWKLDPICVTINYFLPDNKRTLITISTDKDTERMIEFHEDSATVDVYIMSATLAAGDATPLQFSGSSRTTSIEPASPFYASLGNVDIDKWDCSCKGWKLTGLPCCHAIAIFECSGRNPYDYCSEFFTVESFRLAYAKAIHPVPNVDRPVQGELDLGTSDCSPSPEKRPPGQR